MRLHNDCARRGDPRRPSTPAARPTLLLAFAVSATLDGAVTATSAASEPRRPNVLFFALDDLCDWVGPLGNEQAITPHMDRLAARGVTFTNAHTAGIFCAPSRSAIFTGRYAHNTGCYSTQPYFHVRPELRPLQVAFQRSGYQTYGAGKLFHHPAGFVDLRGWDRFFVRFADQRRSGWPLASWSPDDPILPQPYPNSRFNHDRQPANQFFLEWGKVRDQDEEAMADTIRTNWACELLRREHAKPIFVGVGLYAPHFPNYCPEKYFKLYDRDRITPPPSLENDLEDLPDAVRRAKTARSAIHRRLVKLGAVEDAIHGYLACISYADAMLGRLLDAIDAGPNRDNTIVVLWSDHGYHHGEKLDWGKHTLWQRTSQVPFIWSGPGIAPGQKIDATVSLIDMYPTLVDLCGLESQTELDGVSAAKALRDPSTSTDREVVLPGDRPHEFAVINRSWRYIRYADGGEELYDLQNDFHEWRNLAQDPAHAETKRKLRSAGPGDFAPPGRSRQELRLVTADESFSWVPRRSKASP